jgi:hypothetical protein
MGQLNIKDEELIAEAKALAAERAREREAKLAEIMAIGARVAAMVPPGLRTSDHSDLHDENGPLR